MEWDGKGEISPTSESGVQTDEASAREERGWFVSLYVGVHRMCTLAVNVGVWFSR